MKKIAIEVLHRAPEDGHLRATIILPDNLSSIERIGIAKAVLSLLDKEHHTNQPKEIIDNNGTPGGCQSSE